ncbi:F-box/FBD/LRR-repeat protein At3g26920-like [Neltuma alba]|uniref:F-box/FBD/LRR-repeat protein At3g26920-like n=1 Tax=Neltuma alba TaxID=207710 RepID=UPI0010A4FC03|nr:F-box/FBD/LRR-repeat protein At3g26920-like [Prosopis alba]
MAPRSKPRKKAHKLGGSDGIFQFPEAILQKIFFFLPVEDAVSLSAASKTWRNVWTSLPILNLRLDHNEYVTFESFVSSVEDSLSILRSRKAKIESFFLTIDPQEKEGSDLESHLHDWLTLIMKNYVKEIELRVSESPNDIFYTIPQSVFTSKSLVKLQLIGCKFPADILFSDGGGDRKKSRRRRHEFLCLKEIILEDVVARDDQIKELVNHSKNFLEKLTIKTSPAMELLSLEFFLKLSFIEVNVKTLRVAQAMNLDTMVLYGLHRLYASDVWNIKTLRCLTWHTRAYQWIKAFISILPLLETIQMFMVRNEKIQIRSDSLKSFFLCEGQRFEEPIEVEVDAPRLSKIYFTGFSFPEITMLRRSPRVELHHFGHSSGGIDSSQLYRLGKFSQNVIHPLLQIHLHKIFIEYLVDELMNRKETNPNCCPEHNKPKCWRHYIVDVTFELYRSTPHEFDEAEELTNIPLEKAQNGAFSLLQTTTRGFVVQFRLLWLPYPV